MVDPMVVVGDPEFGIAQLLWRRLRKSKRREGWLDHFNVLTEAAELTRLLRAPGH